MNTECGDSSRTPNLCQVRSVQFRNENNPELFPLPVPPPSDVLEISRTMPRKAPARLHSYCLPSRACLPAAQGLLFSSTEPPTHLPPRPSELLWPFLSAHSGALALPG